MSLDRSTTPPATGARRFVATVVGAFLPRGIIGTDDEERARLVIHLALPSALFTLLLAIVIVATGEPLAGAVTFAVTSVALVGDLLLLRVTRQIDLATHVGIGMWTLSTATIGYLRGGFAVSTIAFLGLVPLLALYVTGRNSAIAWTGVVVAICGALWGLAPHPPPVGVRLFDDPDAEHLFNGFAVIGLAMLTLLVGWAFESGRRTADRQRREVEARLRMVERMESVGQLAGGVAHDFNNLLTVVLGSVAVLDAALPADDAARDDLTEIEDAVQRAAVLARQLLVFSRRESVAPELVDLNELIAGMQRLLARTLPENVELEVALTDDAWRTYADPGQLEQLIVNLVVNARDAMPRGGHIAVATSNADLSDPTLASAEQVRPGRYVLMTVTDTGEGMTAAVLARAFEPFFTTKAKGTGTGMGLATVYGTVKKAGGWVWASSRPGGGTTISVYLPAIEPGEDPQALARDDEDFGRGEHILLVEDDDRVRRIAGRILSTVGYQVTEAGTPEEAFNLVAQEKGPFELLLTDVVMPHMSGPELAERLVAEQPKLRVLFMTGYTERALDATSAPPGGLHVVRKPFTEADLRRAVRERLDL